MKLGTYIIAQGDTLETLANQLMGDVNQVSTLVQINQLRYPYISDNPADQFSRPKGNIYLTSQHVNATILNINNPNSIVINPNDTVFVMEGTSNRSSIVQSATPTTITLTSSLTGTFDQAAIVTIYVNQQNITSQVLKTGGTLLYPIDSTSATNTVNSLSFGADWLLDSKGFLVKTNGDIGIVKGLNNLAQALSMRLRTSKGALNMHPRYGNELFNILGESGNPYFRGLAKNYIEQCVMQDIRVRKVTITNFSLSSDKINVGLTIFPVSSQNPITQSVTIPITGV